MFPDPKRLRIGCSGWSYADWVGPFYPKDAKPGDYLHLYSTIFDAVEIDSTYYRTPSPLMVANWRKITTDGFIFSAKFPKKITHELKLRQPSPARTLLQVNVRATREARTASDPVAPLVQHQEGQGRARNIPRTDRPEIQARHRVPEQVLVETRNLQTTRKEQRRPRLVREPIR